MKQEFQFSEIVQLIKQAKANAYKAINIELINCYWQVGEYISRRIAEASWGDKTIKDHEIYRDCRYCTMVILGNRLPFLITSCMNALHSPSVMIFLTVASCNRSIVV